jgi:hypothetical protein
VSLEAPIEPLAVAAVPSLGLELLFPPHGEQAILKKHFHVSLFEARKFGGDPILLFSLLNIHTGPGTANSPEPGVVKASKHIIEETIHLPMQIHHWADGIRSCRRATLTINPSPGNKISNIHGRYLLNNGSWTRAI